MKRSWSRPELLPEPHELAAPPFPLDFLPEPFRARVRDVAERIGVPPDMAAIAMISQVATAAGANFKIRLKEKDRWLVRPTAWAAIIAPPASYKTPIIDEIMAPWHTLEAWRMEQYKEAQQDYLKKREHARLAKKLWEEACRKARKVQPMPAAAEEPEKPRKKRVVVNDVTLEALIEILHDSDGHLAIVADELAGVFKRFNQYRGGSDREFYLSLHAGTSYAYDRKMAGSIFLKNPFANILGGIQPAKIHTFVEDSDADGLQARFGLMVWPTPPATFKYVDRLPDGMAAKAVEARLNKIIGFTCDAAVELRFSTEAQGEFVDWYTHHRRRLLRMQPILRAHLGKYDGLYGVLCIVHHLMQGRGPSDAVEQDTAAAVAELIEDYLLPHAKKIYSYASESSTYGAAKRVSDWLLKNPDVGQFTRRDIRQLKWQGLHDDKSVERALRLLTKKSWLRKVEKANTGGRPTDKYHVNPLIHDL